MPVDCQRSTSGGKGNLGMFIERDPKICSAGLPTSQPDETVGQLLKQYNLDDEVDCLISDAIIPPPKERPLPPLRHPMKTDKRNGGTFTDMADLINPPIKSKFQTLVDDFKNTSYASYYYKPLGQSRDPIPMFPAGYDIQGTTYGKKTADHGRFYDIVMPKVPYPDKTPDSKKQGVQLNRHYCSPPYDGSLIFGHRTYAVKSGRNARCCITDDRITVGTGNRCLVNTVQSNFIDTHQPRAGKVLAPYENINEVPYGYAFGKLKAPDNLPECLTTCTLNPNTEKIRKCMKHYNTLRKCLKTRYLPTFFGNFYLSLKYIDKEKSGWLPKDVVYNFCATKFIRFDPALIEPLLSLWNAFDGSHIEYKTFVYSLNYKQPPPSLPKLPDVPDECLYFETTYREMVKPDQPEDTSLMAGLPSGRYFDRDFPVTPRNYSRAANAYLPDESDVRACICPSIMTNVFVSHRDFYAKRDKETIRRVFEAAGETFSDESFEATWAEAEKYHSQGWVCVETFRKAIKNTRVDKQTGP